MYAAEVSSDLFQGDIVNDFPFVILKDVAAGEFNEQGEAEFPLKAKLSRVILLSQTCDLQQRQYVIVCPVYPLASVSLNSNNVTLVKKRRMYQWFYLPKVDGVIEDSLADFQSIYYVPQTLVNQYKEKRLLSLSDWGRHHLGWALSAYFGRPIESK